MQNRCGKFAIPSLRSLRLPPGTPEKPAFASGFSTALWRDSYPVADAHFPPACLRMQNRCGKFAIPSLRSLRLPPGTPDHGGKVRASENTAGNARSRRQGPCKRERRRERQKNPLLQAGFPLRYGGTLTLWLTLFYPAKNSFGGGPGLIPHKTCVLWNKCGKFAVPLLSAGLTITAHHVQTVIKCNLCISRATA